MGVCKDLTMILGNSIFYLLNGGLYPPHKARIREEMGLCEVCIGLLEG